MRFSGRSGGMADAPDSKSGALTGVWVQVPSPVPGGSHRAERCQSGRLGTPGERVHPTRVPGVRIPPSPPFYFAPTAGRDFLRRPSPRARSSSSPPRPQPSSCPGPQRHRHAAPRPEFLRRRNRPRKARRGSSRRLGLGEAPRADGFCRALPPCGLRVGARASSFSWLIVLCSYFC